MRAIGRIDDLADNEIDWILDRAELVSSGAEPDVGRPRQVVGLVFLEASLRTRVGFAAAGARLGWGVVEVDALRPTGGNFAESEDDTVRMVAGQCDVVVVRAAQPFERSRLAASDRCHLINGGDAGPDAEHPTQALIDLFAIEQLRGEVGRLSIAIVGDPRTRAARSLLRLLQRRQPAETVVVAPSSVGPAELEQAPEVSKWTTDLAKIVDCDIVYVTGMAHDSVPAADRQRLTITASTVDQLDPSAIVLCPMPLLDEVDPAVREHPTMRFTQQADMSAAVRQACLEFAVRHR